MKARTFLGGLGLSLVFLSMTGACSRSTPSLPVSASGENDVMEWTCSMHPQIRANQPGRCPICGMDLVPIKTTGAGAVGRGLELSAEAEALAEIETAIVEPRPLIAELRWAGTVAPDETRLKDIAPLTGGRLEKLYANAEGLFVRAGDPLAEIFSPEIASALRELRAAAALPGSHADWLTAARTRLRRFGLTEDDIYAAEQQEVPGATYRLRSPTDGVVTTIYTRERGWVESGQAFLRIADLSRVWIWFDAYESDLELIQPGLRARVTVEALPARRFEGVVSFVSPVLNEATRTVRVRVEAENPDGALRPGLFARAHLEVPLHSNGVMPLALPATAPLITGRRAIVYVKIGPHRYEGREIELGRRAGDFYAVLSGLRDGDEVVTRGAMKIDSTLQLQARPSMMNSGGGNLPEEPSPPGHAAAATEGVPGMTAAHSKTFRQTHCPVMGGAIRPDLYVEYRGHRIFLCCPACVELFPKTPETYWNRVRQVETSAETIREQTR